MNPDMSSTPTPMPETPKKKSNTPVIIAVIVVVVLCICCAVGGGIYLYQNGDKIFGTGLLLMQSL